MGTSIIKNRVGLFCENLTYLYLKHTTMLSHTKSRAAGKKHLLSLAFTFSFPARLRLTLTLAGGLLFTFSARSQWVSIPDSNFGKWLNTNGYSTCLHGNSQTGWQMDTSCPAVVNEDTIQCGYFLNIKDLTGISYFHGLRYLSCRSNLLSSFPPLPMGITDLLCMDNQLTSLPILPDSLKNMSCYNNQLTSLPDLPAGLIRLSCYDNQLTSLPALPAGLDKLFCYNNQIGSLPALPSFMSYCYLYNNPLNCLPPLGLIGYLDITNTNITCLPNRGNVIYFTPQVYLPLCDVFNASGCFPNLAISGKVYVDNNHNCLKDTNEVEAKNVSMQLLLNSTLQLQTNTNQFGLYSFDANALGTYEIKIDSTRLPFHIMCPVSGFHTSVLSVSDSLDYDLNFGIECKPDIDLAAWSIEGRFRPANISKVVIHVGSLSSFYGVNCADGVTGGVTGSITVVINGPAHYVAPAPGALTPNNINGNMLTYNIPDFGTVDFNNSFGIMVQTDTIAHIGNTICFTVTITTTNTDAAPANNTLTHCFPVVASVDPNNKEVYPISDVDVSGDRWLTYTINFQNTGTDTAIHVYITDTLDSDLDVSSFQLLAYSHQPMVQIKENAVRFNFPNIMLVDSHANEPLSHGYVQYKIKIKDNKPVGTVINNTAFIYFDFNAPVVTNTTTNTIATITAVSPLSLGEGLGVRLFPNPSQSGWQLTVDDSYIGGTAQIFDINGQLVFQSLILNSLSSITPDIAKGVYLLRLNSGKSSVVKKLIRL